MAKKRKAGGRAYGDAKAPKNDESKLAINSWEDVADSEDEFLLNREKVMLDEGPAAKRLRKHQEEDKFLDNSEEEILGDNLSDSDDDDEDEDDASEAAASDDQAPDDEDEEMDEAWGATRKDYYNADAIETEQDALDEEKEARRLQKKQLQAMSEAAFGFDEDEWLGQGEEEEAEGGARVTEVLPQLQITDSMSEEERLKIMKTRYPEFEHISREYLRLQPLHDELAAAANAAERLLKSQKTNSSKSTKTTPVAVTKYRACAAYLAAMAMYFAILGSTAKDDGTSTIAMDPKELHEHPVMESLLKTQRLWTKVESLPVGDPMVETDAEELSVIEEASALSGAELDQAPKKKAQKQKKTKAERVAEAARAEAKARRAEKLLQTEQDLGSLSALTDKAALKKASRKKKVPEGKLNLLNPDDSDFGEETDLTAHELAEKARKKKSLRFYTSQIAQKANKRDAAGKDYGGDADVPHRERLKDRQARLQLEAEKRGAHANHGPGAALGEGPDSSGDEAEPFRPEDNDFDDEDGYYDMVAARSNTKKAAKADRAAAYAEAKAQGAQVVEAEVIGDDGRRQITYQIEKNKGLTPHRKKSVRNPRVKKKEKYAEKLKKEKSMRPVFDKAKASAGHANYGGEMTGIKKGMVRSRKL
ncbi:something about silencing protein 10 [Didymella glomerata]|uniref:Something about silencing protein 10 n=1 Tax=Didymella glomerata TaxID=749621 RepID=A0A9W8X5N2_9PLEO|nr:something about silencing protein 10 [Didymella glomerata]